MTGRKHFGFMIALIAFCAHQAFAHTERPTFVVEEKLNTLPSSIDAAVRADKSFVDFKDCDLVGKNIPLAENKDYLVFVATTVDGCDWGNAIAPIWIIRTDNAKPSVILNEGGYALQLLSQTHNGLYDISISAATAGWSINNTWVFNGSVYIKTSPQKKQQNKI